MWMVIAIHFLVGPQRQHAAFQDIRVRNFFFFEEGKT